METNSRNHWELVYETKQPNEVSSTQKTLRSPLIISEKIIWINR